MENDVKIISALKVLMGERRSEGRKSEPSERRRACVHVRRLRIPPTETLLRLPRIFPQRARDSLGAAPNPEVTFSLRFTLDSRGSEGKKGDVEKASSADGVVAVTE